jgi:hypothetical protein
VSYLTRVPVGFKEGSTCKFADGGLREQCFKTQLYSFQQSKAFKVEVLSDETPTTVFGVSPWAVTSYHCCLLPDTCSFITAATSAVHRDSDTTRPDL